MSTKMTRRSFAALAAAAGLVLSGCASSSEAAGGASEELTEVTVAVSSKIAYFVPYLMEEHWGEFAAEGIDLKVEIAPAQDALVMLATGKLDAMVTGPSANLLNAVADGTNVKIVAPGGIEPADSINGWYVSKAALGDQEFDISMLKGKTLASSSGVAGPPLLSLARTLETEGLTLADVDIKSMKQADTIIAIENGAVFGGTASQPNTAIIEEKDSGVFFARSAPEDYPSVNVWFGSTLLDDAPEVGERFIQALHNTYMNRLQGDWLHDPQNIELISEVLETDVSILEDIPSTVYPEEFTFPDGFIESYEEAFRQIPGVLTYGEDDSLGDSVIDTRFMDKINSK
ncbi:MULTISPECIES: ABC transporter substrate-binding protein [Arthrobacter]|nr:ABC transporter substrate-binding protein [Arthrobacter citreus]